MSDERMPVDACYEQLADRLSDYQSLMRQWLNSLKTNAQNLNAPEFKEWVWSTLRPELERFHDDLKRQVEALRGTLDDE